MVVWKTRNIKGLTKVLSVWNKNIRIWGRVAFIILGISFLSQCASEIVSERVEKGARNTVYKLAIYKKEQGIFADVMETYSQTRTLVTEKVIKGNKCTAEPMEWAFLTALTFGLGVFSCFDDPNQEITTYVSEDTQTPLSGYAPLKNAIVDGEIVFPPSQNPIKETLLALEYWPAVGIKLTDHNGYKRLGLSLRIASTETEELLHFTCALELDSAGTASCYDQDSVKRIEGDDHWYSIGKLLSN